MPWTQQSNCIWGWSYPQIAMPAYTPYRLIESKPWVSHSHCAHIITKDHICCSLLIPGGRMKYFSKSWFAIVTTGFCSVSPRRMHWHPVPQEIKQSHARATMHWYTTSNRQGIFFTMRLFAKLLDDGLFDSHRWCMCTAPVSTKHFSLMK
jgi:hypothetical protein